MWVLKMLIDQCNGVELLFVGALQSTTSHVIVLQPFSELCNHSLDQVKLKHALGKK